MEFIANLFKKSDPKKLIVKKPDEDFIPYVCHYDPQTIITKNGELLQVLRVTGFGKESIVSNLVTLRETIREAFAKHIEEDKFAFWIHTIRRKKNIIPKSEFNDFFSTKINEEWTTKNHFDDQYVNELYVTLIIEGIDSSIMNFKSLSRSFSYYATQNLHRNFLQDAHKKLTKTTLNILAELEEFGAKLLTINEWDGILYSEPMRFFGKICNLYEERYPLTLNDISNDLSVNKIAFGQRELEVSGSMGKNFASVLSLKEYHEVSTGSLDKILQLPLEFIITQSFDFTFNKKDLENYEYQNYLLQVSNDEDFRQMIGAANFAEADKGSDTDYGKLQTTVMIINQDREKLEKDIEMTIEKFSSLGYILVREDVFCEHCFWSQLPGNFAFLRRQKIINTGRIAGFAALHSFPTGVAAGNHWGSALTILNTVLETPYFFNFHDKDLGHTLIIGPKGSGKTTLTNFLLTQARKFNNKIFYFDLNQSAKPFINSLMGNYHRIISDTENPEFLQMNPFSLPKNEETKVFLVEWIVFLLMFLKGDIPDHEIDMIPKVVEQVMALENPSFTIAFNAFNTAETRSIYKKLRIWNDGNLGNIFSSHTDIDWTNKINAFDFSEIIDHKPILIPVLHYLMHRVELSLDGSPAIVVFDDAWEMFDNEVIVPILDDFLKRLRQKNCIAIMISRDIEELGHFELSHILTENVATEIYFPNREPQEYYKSIFHLTEDEFDIIKMMAPHDHHFLLKHAGDSLIIDANLSVLGDYIKILSADEVTLAAMEEVIAAEVAENPDKKAEAKNWIPHLIEILQEIEKHKKEEERKIAKEKAEEQLKNQEEESK